MMTGRGMSLLVAVRRGLARQVDEERRGSARHGEARRGEAWQAQPGWVRLVVARCGRLTRRGKARIGLVWRGTAGQVDVAWLGVARLGMARQVDEA